MRLSLRRAASILALTAAPGGAHAQFQPSDPLFAADEVVVRGERRTGAVIGDIKPELVLDAGDILSYGASSIDELLAALAPQTQSGSGRGEGRPAILLNGRRVSSYREIRQYPPEALERVEVLPEEVALKYGFRADQRVVNFVLRERFRALTADAGVGGATDGGRWNGAASANLLRLRENRRWNVDLEYDYETALFEDERDFARASGKQGDVIGNVFAKEAGGEVDPALSALAGETVVVAGAPASAASGPALLGDFFAGDANATDIGAYRTLEPRSQKASLTGAYTDIVFGGVAATATASLDYSESEAALGLAEATLLLPAGSPYSPFSTDVSVARLFLEPGALTRRKNEWEGQAGFALNSEPSAWTWSVNGQFSRADAHTTTERGVSTDSMQGSVLQGSANPFGPLPAGDYAVIEEAAETIANTALIEGVVFGDVASLPAGALSATMKAGADLARLKSVSRTVEGTTLSRLGRDQANAQINIDAPVFADGKTPAPLGEMTLSANARIDHLSDFGTLATYGYSLAWRPVSAIQFLASVTEEQGAPTMNQLGDPVLRTPNVRLYDFATGETVENVTRISGGAADLASDERRVLRLNLTVEPFEEENLRLTASYTDQRTENAIAAFPSLTPDIEAAFPERFLRDANGALIEIDARPVNFARTEQRQLRYGFFWSKQLKVERRELTEEERQRMREIMGRRGARGGDETGRPPGGRGRGGGRPGGRGADGRLHLSVHHTIVFEDSILISEDGQTLDLLNGDAINASGGASRHALNAMLGYSKNGLGARLSYDWQSATSILNGGDDDLYFDDFGTLDLRLTLDPARRRSLLLKYPFLLGARLSVEIDNVLNSRQRVYDGDGATPANFQPELLDPLGRTIMIRYRKIFF